MKNVLLGFVLTSLLVAVELFALPFNDDMVDNQITAGQIMRPRPENSRPVGAEKSLLADSKEEALELENPKPLTKESVLRGKRIFAVNCSACHGEIGKVHVPYPAGQYMGAPNLADPLYHDRTAGSVYGTIYFGNAIMPAVGWKISSDEAWDVINYVRSEQNANTPQPVTETTDNQ